MDKFVNDLDKYVELISNKKAEVLQSTSDEINFFEKVISSLDIDNVSTFLDFSNINFLIICLKLFNQSLNFSELLNNVSLIKEYIEDPKDDYEAIGMAAGVIKRIISESYGMKPDIIKARIAQESVDNYLRNKQFCDFINKYEAFEVLNYLYSFMHLKKFIGCELANYSGKSKKALIKLCGDYLKNRLSSFEISKYSFPVSSQRIFLEEYRDIKDIFENFTTIYLSRLRKINKDCREQSKKVLNSAKELKRELTHPVEEPAINKRFTISDDYIWQFDSSVLTPLFKQVETNIRNRYAKLCTENETLSKELDFTELQKYLTSLGVNYEKIPSEIEKLLYAEKNLDKVKKIVNFLIGLDYSPETIFTSNLVYIVLGTVTMNVDIIQRFIELNYLSADFVKSNLGILLSGNQYQSEFDPYFTILFNNVSFLQSQGLKLDSKDYDRKMLLITSDQLSILYNLLVPYNLSNDDLLFMLGHMDKLEVIDMMLENSIDLSLLQQIIKSYDSKLAIKKMLICESIGENIVSSRNILSKLITGYDNFYINDAEVDNCIFNETPNFLKEYQNDTDINAEKVLEELERKYLENSCFVIGEVKISALKVKRNLYKCKTIKELLTIMLANVIATSDQINDVISVIMLASFPQDFAQLKMPTNQ